ncbi:MAG: RNA polymerase sigma factor [Candidatus Sungbacteria bacterium]|nr:RNA polymerase sigma factor [Candidatus Sungbacteria bacterium]
MPKKRTEYLGFEENAEGEQEQFTDEDVLEAAKHRPGLFEILVDRYQASFLRVAQRVVKNREAAEDVVQEAFIKIYRFAKHFDKNKAKFKSWAYKIVMNVAITHYNRKKNDAMLIPEEYDPTVTESQRVHAGFVHERGIESVISSALEEIPEDLRSLLQAYYLEDKSYRNIAKEGGLSMGALKMKLFRARKSIKKVLEQRGEV